jgi:hypothetical protein
MLAMKIIAGYRSPGAGPRGRWPRRCSRMKTTARCSPKIVQCGDPRRCGERGGCRRESDIAQRERAGGAGGA